MNVLRWVVNYSNDGQDDDDDYDEEQDPDYVPRVGAEDEDDDDDDDDEGAYWQRVDEDEELEEDDMDTSLLPEHVRESIDRVFAGEAYSPMLFVRSEHECEQQKLMANERIAHQLRSYTSIHADPRVSRREKRQSEEEEHPLKSEDGQGLSKNDDDDKGWDSPQIKRPKHQQQRMFRTLCMREQIGKTTSVQLIKLQETFMPFQEHKHCKVVDYVNDRLYCGGFNSTGSQFLVAGQRSDILVYDTVTWKRKYALPARDVRWTVTDAKFTPDDRHVLYSSINSNIWMVSCDQNEKHREDVFSLVRAPRGSGLGERMSHRFGRFGVWCMDINASGTEFVAGTSSHSVVLYDITTKSPVCHVMGHDDDVNAIAFVDGPLHTNVFVSGSDDALIKLWDRRVLSESNPKPQGVFPGHIDGLTHISSRDDGYYFISNSKDQTSKLWDIRKCLSAEAHDGMPHYRRPYAWDYRYEAYPGSKRLPVSHPNDKSVMTYRGHMVMETLIRCHFSPLHSTAQKYIYTGSADGRVYVYDVLTGNLVEVFAMRPNGLTRDVRWHPYDPTIVSPDFYGKLCIWQRQDM